MVDNKYFFDEQVRMGFTTTHWPALVSLHRGAADWLKHGLGIETCFEFGSGLGFFLVGSQWVGLDTIGYDINPYERDFALSRGVEPHRYILKDWTRGQAKYFKALKAEQPDYSVVCLENVAFNHAKSNISMLEFMLAGAPCIAPAYMPEFNIPGVIQYGNPKAAPGEHNPDSLGAIFRHIDEGKDIGHREAYQACEDHISNHLVLSVVNQQRLKLLYAEPTKTNT